MSVKQGFVVCCFILLHSQLRELLAEDVGDEELLQVCIYMAARWTVYWLVLSAL